MVHPAVRRISLVDTLFFSCDRPLKSRSCEDFVAVFDSHAVVVLARKWEWRWIEDTRVPVRRPLRPAPGTHEKAAWQYLSGVQPTDVLTHAPRGRARAWRIQSRGKHNPDPPPLAPPSFPTIF